ncbi:MAG TPA: hypothetical protein VGO34_15305 [Alphaproteobacteria bacterium]
MTGKTKIHIANVSLEKESALTSEDKAKFGYFGENAKIMPPYRILNPQNIFVGDGTVIREGSHISAFTDLSFLLMHVEPQYRTDFDIDAYRYKSRIEFGRAVQAGRFLFISCTNSVSIGDDVLLSERIFIGDNNHGFSHPDVPIVHQPNTRGRPVAIGRGSWIGVGAALLGGTELGRNCVVGANAVCRDMSCESHSVIGSETAKVLYRRRASDEA